jgi:hypothetical protein
MPWSIITGCLYIGFQSIQAGPDARKICKPIKRADLAPQKNKKVSFLKNWYVVGVLKLKEANLIQ